MPPRRQSPSSHRRHKPYPTSTSSTSHCKFPHEVILNILTRLPALSLLRFKSVCQPWNTLISTPKFITLHRLQTAINPDNDSLIIHSLNQDSDHLMSLLNVNTTQTEPTPLTHPFPPEFFRMDLVGSIYGVVCLACPPLGHMIVLWNPAINHWKPIRLSNHDLGNGNPEKVSLGLAFDADHEDFKVVRIVNLRPTGRTPKVFMLPSVEVYSAKKDSWKMVKLDFQFCVGAVDRCNVIVKGEPYWIAFVIDPGDESKAKEVLIKFDVKTERLKQLPLPSFKAKNARVVAWKDSLAWIVVSPLRNSAEIADFWVYDEGQGFWGKKFTVGPIGMTVYRPLQCSKNGEILAEDPEGKLFLFDHKSNSVRVLRINGAQKLSYEACIHTESLVRFKGMELVKKEEVSRDPMAAMVKYMTRMRSFSNMNLLVKTKETGPGMEEQDFISVMNPLSNMDI